MLSREKGLSKEAGEENDNDQVQHECRFTHGSAWLATTDFGQRKLLSSGLLPHDRETDRAFLNSKLVN